MISFNHRSRESSYFVGLTEFRISIMPFMISDFSHYDQFLFQLDLPGQVRRCRNDKAKKKF